MALDPTPHAASAPSDPGTSAREPLDRALLDRLRAKAAGGGAGTVTTTVPFTGEPLVELPLADAGDVAAAFERARRAQRAWARLAPRDRVAPFVRFHDLVLRRQHEILDIVQWETGKARKHAFEEVYDAAAGTLFSARRAPGLLARRRHPGALPLATRTYEFRRPKGVVSVITPWNYPLSLPVGDAVPALLAGNAVVAKPDTQTALATLWSIELLEEAGLPEGLWQVVLGEPAEIGGPLVEHADHIAFTGSTRSGAQVAREAAGRLKGVSLELGGKNPAVVRSDADLDWTVEGVLRGCFTNAGQLCISMERVYVHEGVYDAFVSRFVRAVESMRLGADLDFTADMGSLTYQRQLEAVERHVEDARAKGVRVLAGGRARPDLGPLFYEPTVLEGVTEEMAVCAEETFGPVVALYRVRDDDEAVEHANATGYGLNASVWTRDVPGGRRLAERLEAGTVNINDGYGAAFASYGAPMGGMKRSGLGRRHGAEGLLRYTEAQTIASQHYVPLSGPPGMRGDTYAAVLTAVQRLAKRLRIR
ncbi:succinic semialdehyde dehydrogenase [Allonocardiopsis opalescens]|uniref:Aldehyde dehydrogenase (NAD+)/succinate-semialdehyde dehydrogenase/glutarate-semialdehyde dehydrogenase n=1 Tax=Allonocardiopsis opalescens TaxID=1144618 RepID=A0A2T0Q890_9ACTN|nr:succinic semialdehyde dehydrogenase [Allonocardiopsis opalescens]PRY00046.1 aldehyde dehydrogenase (NAD+)/succinate-semialdehyde dehydrogenase/glutarate-semialdehyde dehydrogenase [Allonocardiopsis opalescens]